MDLATGSGDVAFKLSVLKQECLITAADFANLSIKLGLSN